MNRGLQVAVALLWCAPFIPHVFAQLTAGSITGIVADTSGAVIPGAEVIMTNASTGIVARTQTNQAGLFVATSLLPGPYNLGVVAQGFKRKEAQNLCKPARRCEWTWSSRLAPLRNPSKCMPPSRNCNRRAPRSATRSRPRKSRTCQSTEARIRSSICPWDSRGWASPSGPPHHKHHQQQRYFPV